MRLPLFMCDKTSNDIMKKQECFRQEWADDGYELRACYGPKLCSLFYAIFSHVYEHVDDSSMH